MDKFEKVAAKAVEMVKGFGYGLLHPIKATTYDFDDDAYNENAVLAGATVTGGLLTAAAGIVTGYAVIGGLYTKAYEKGNVAIRDAQYPDIWRAKNGYYTERNNGNEPDGDKS